jgi:hypothetical protein
LSFHRQRRLQQPPDFVVRVNMRSCPLGTEPQQTDRRDFGLWISTNAVTSKAPDDG